MKTMVRKSRNQNLNMKNFIGIHVPGRIHQKDLEKAYNQIVYWRKNIFTVPTGAVGKKIIDEISRLLDL